MSGTASWLHRHGIEVGWVAFAGANLAAMGLFSGYDGGTVPFHFIWVSLTLLYGYAVWRIGPTVVVLVVVMASTTAMILLEVSQGPTSPYELTEVPLMAAMFLAMVWHAQRAHAAEQAAHRAREREREFVRDSSHHLKTPLQLARSYGELIRKGQQDGHPRDDADALIVELDRLAKLVNGLLVYMTSEEPQVLQRRTTDVEGLVIGVAGRWMDAVDRDWGIDVTSPGTLFVDADRLEYALDALIENAVSATSPGGRISITAEGQADTLTIRVVDDGHGIAPDALEHVFDRFWTRAGRMQRQGTGLGLAIVKAVVEAHHGTVEVRSNGFGTEFALHLGSFTASDSGSSSGSTLETDLRPVVATA